MKQFSLPLLRDLPLQSIEFQNRLAGRQSSGPDAMCLFWVMKSRLRWSLWPFNQSPEWFSTGLSAHLSSLRMGANPRKATEVEGNESSHKLPCGHLEALGLLTLTQNTPLSPADSKQSIPRMVKRSNTEKYAGICDSTGQSKLNPVISHPELPWKKTCYLKCYAVTKREHVARACSRDQHAAQFPCISDQANAQSTNETWSSRRARCAKTRSDRRRWWGESTLWFFSALQCVSDCLMRPY